MTLQFVPPFQYQAHVTVVFLCHSMVMKVPFGSRSKIVVVKGMLSSPHPKPWAAPGRILTPYRYAVSEPSPGGTSTVCGVQTRLVRDQLRVGGTACATVGHRCNNCMHSRLGTHKSG